MDSDSNIGDTGDMPTDPDFAAWLKSCGFAEYVSAFQAEGIDFDVLEGLGEADLQSLGLTLGNRKRFAAALVARREPTHTSATVERRNLSVLFCDLVGSTVLANNMDAEEYAELVSSYSRACRDAVTSSGGVVAKYTGDGVMAYFGYPISHGDDAVRAITAGLAIQAAVDRLSVLRSIGLRARVGIATGVTIVGNVLGDDSLSIIDAVGDTPTLASRVESNAPIGSVTVSELTRRLTEESFAFEDLGAVSLKGFAEPMRLNRVLGRRGRALSFEDGNKSLVGRKDELAGLLEQLEEAGQGPARAVMIVGEAGVGKSRLLAAFGSIATSQGWTGIQFACTDMDQLVQAHPLRRAMADAADVQIGDTDERRTRKLEDLAERLGLADDAAIFTGLFDRAGAGNSSGTPTDSTQATTAPAERRRALFEGVRRVVADLARPSPLLIAIEDVHWADVTTMALVDHILTELMDAHLLVVLTSRPNDSIETTSPLPSRRPLLTVQLDTLDERDAREMVVEVAGRPIDPELVSAILQRSDGLPLYLSEVTRALLERESLTLVDGMLTIGEDGNGVIPLTLHDGLGARLDRLRTGGRLAPIAAALGRSFSLEMLTEVAEDLDVAAGIRELIDSKVLTTGEAGTIRFRHSLLRDAAYARMLRPDRRRIHERAAVTLVEKFPETALGSPHLVASHFQESSDPTRSVVWWFRAAENAAHHSASAEVVAASEAALAVLRSSSMTDELARTELDVQLLLAGALRGTAGFAAPVTGAAYARARELCEVVGEQDRLLTVLNGVYSFHMVRDEYDLAGSAARDLLERADHSGRLRDAIVANRAVGAVAFHTGRLAEAEHHLTRSIELYKTGDFESDRFVFGTDHASTASCFLALTQWVRGQRRTAVETVGAGIEHAGRLDHQHSWVQALTHQCFVAILERSWSTIEEVAPTLIERSEHHGFALMAITGRFWKAAAAFFRGDHSAIDEMQATSDAWWNTGARSYFCFRTTLIAEAFAMLGRPEIGLSLINSGLDRIEVTNERWSEAEALRIRARLLHLSGDRDGARRALGDALGVADAQGASSWALRVELERVRLGLAEVLDPAASVRTRALRIDADSTCIDLHDVALLGT